MAIDRRYNADCSVYYHPRGMAQMAIEEIVGSSGDSKQEGSATFVFDFVHVNAAFDDVRVQVKMDHGNWLGVTAADALTKQSFLTKVGPGGLISKKVEIQLGEVRDAMGALIVPLCWMATTTPFLFPKLDGDVEFSEMDPGHVRIALRGSYRVPLGSFGERIDKMIMHRMAESTVRSFLLGVASELQRRPTSS